MELSDISSKLADGKCLPVLADMSDVKSVDRKSREYISGKEAMKTARSLAIIIKSPMSKVVGNFLIGLNKPPYPIKMFTSKDEAIGWLRTFLD
jgi:hypothetical protein